MIQTLLTHIEKFCPLQPDDAGIIASLLEYKVYKKKELLLTEGQRCFEKLFIVKGCVHLCYLRQNGTEQTIDFAMEDWWISDFMAFQQGSPAQFSIRAIEPTAVLCLSADNQRELLRLIPQLNAYFHLVFQRGYAAAQMRVRYLYEFSKEELYLHFVDRYPAFVQRVPQYLLASFLGFTPEYLSELRKKSLS